MITQKDVYELVKQCVQGDQEALSKTNQLSKSGQITFDRLNGWYRPTNEIGTPMDRDLHNSFWSGIDNAPPIGVKGNCVKLN